MAESNHDSSHGSRKFYELPKDVSLAENKLTTKNDSTSLFSYIDKETIGSNAKFLGPFGWRNVIYCDNTASSRSLSFIEKYIHEEVLPFYGNTHTTTTVSSMQTTLYRHESRDIIRRVVNASEEDVVIFTGTGCTGAINKLVHALDFKHGGVVFIGPFEHHSNILPWKEAGFDIIWITVTKEGDVNMDDLETKLLQNKERNIPMIGSFSAASNITGILTNVDKVAFCLHKHGALAFFDYATAGPYVELNMNPLSNQGKSYKDAMFLSPHKFPGGPGTPGILVAKKNLFQSNAPSNTGGGGIFYVTHNTHRYLKDIETREESGTPDIAGSIRTGMVFQLRESINTNDIAVRDEHIVSLINSKLDSVSNSLIILGASEKVKRLPIISFVIKHIESGRLLHYNFVSVLLNDLFGIQARSGCACSGPYAQQLLGMNESLALKYESLLLEDDRLDRHHLRKSTEGSTRETLRPGFTRVGLAYFSSDEFVEFVLEAIKLIAQYGWRLLPLYSFNAETGEWKCRGFRKFKDRKWLGSISYNNGRMEYKHVNQVSSQENVSIPNFNEVLNEARKLLTENSSQKSGQVAFTDTVIFDADVENYRWFLLPSEAQEHLDNVSKKYKPNFVLPFYPGKLDQISSSLNTNNLISEHRIEENNISKPQEANVKLTPVQNVKFINPSKCIMTPLIKAIEEFKMIQNGDRVLLCLSGGKDSLSMLHAINQFKHVALAKGIQFSFGAMTVDPQSASYDPSPLKYYLADLDVPYFYEEQNIIKQAAELTVCESICSFCSRMKRGRIYACARREGYNVVALGQHLDDIAESFMMSVFHNGFLRTMKANYYVREGDLRVIRPLIYAREQNLRKFAEKSKLPIIAENCPACFEEPKERHRVKQLLAQQEILYPNLYKSFSTALHPLFAKNRTGLEKSKFSNDNNLDEDE